MHADRTNRTVLTLLGLILLAAGVAGALLSFGVFGADPAHAELLDNFLCAYIGANSGWFWIAAAVGGLLLIVLGFRWLIALSFSTDRVNELPVAGNRERGQTTLTSSALTAAVTEEIEGYRGVHSANARVIGDISAPRLVLEVALEDTAELTAVRDRIVDEAIAHARQALDAPALPVIVDLSITDKHESRVG